MANFEGLSDAFSLLLWALFLPLIIVMVLRSRQHHADGAAHSAEETGAHKSAQQENKSAS